MRLRLAAVLLLLASPAWAQRNGSYAVEGRGVNGEPYRGVVELRATGAETWVVVWRIGETVSRGVGLRLGDQFSVGYVSDRQTGVAVYDINGDGSMVGRWTQGGEGGVGIERLVPR